MTINGGKDAGYAIVFLHICSLGIPVLFYIQFKMLTLSIIVFLLLILFTFRFWVAFGRTLKMDSKGITVKFLWYQKQFLWEELKGKRYFNASDCIAFNIPAFPYGVEFSAEELRRSPKTAPETYCLLFHPFSYVFVRFTPDRTPTLRSENRYFSDNYTVNEEKFRNQMKEWGQENRPLVP